MRQRASLILSQLYRVAATQKAAGELLRCEPWLKVLANILSSVPAGRIGKRNGRDAPDYWELSYNSLLIAAQRCGVDVSAEEIEGQVADTSEWRARESRRIGRAHYMAMRPEKIGALVGMTDEIWREAKAWNLTPYGSTRAARAALRREKHRMRDEAKRRAAGARSHAESLFQTKPWVAAGISRRTWYRRRLDGPTNDQPDDGGTNSCATNKLAQKNLAMIKKSEASERIRRIRANVLHLVDIKRAGHSPRHCELLVDGRDRIVAQPMRRASPASKPRPMALTILCWKRKPT